MVDRTKPDLLVATGSISTGGATNPFDLHVITALRTINYLLQHSHYGLALGEISPIFIFALYDASYITDEDAKSRFGGCIFLKLTLVQYQISVAMILLYLLYHLVVWKQRLRKLIK